MTDSSRIHTAARRRQNLDQKHTNHCDQLTISYWPTGLLPKVVLVVVGRVVVVVVGRVVVVVVGRVVVVVGATVVGATVVGAAVVGAAVVGAAVVGAAVDAVVGRVVLEVTGAAVFGAFVEAVVGLRAVDEVDVDSLVVVVAQNESRSTVSESIEPATLSAARRGGVVVLDSKSPSDRPDSEAT